MLSRSQILDDAMNLARAGQLSYDIALDLTKSLIDEDDIMVVYTFDKRIEFLDNMVNADDRYESLRTYIREGVQGLYNKVGI